MKKMKILSVSWNPSLDSVPSLLNWKKTILSNPADIGELQVKLSCNIRKEPLCKQRE